MEAQSKTILVYNLEKEKGLRIRTLCKRKGIEIRAICPAQYLEPIGALAGIHEIEPLDLPYGGPAFSDEMLIFSGFSNDSLSDFLKAYRQEGIPAINLKATTTPYNLVWNSVQLHEELKREHEELTKNA